MSLIVRRITLKTVKVLDLYEGMTVKMGLDADAAIVSTGRTVELRGDCPIAGSESCEKPPLGVEIILLRELSRDFTGCRSTWRHQGRP